MIGIRLGFVWLLIVAAGCAWGDPEERITLGDPVASAGVRRLDALADGRRAMHGAPWNVSSAATFEDDAFVVFDLGEVMAIDAAYVHGDNNDRFIIETSVDGGDYSRLWTAPAVGGDGLRARWRKDLGGSGRFVRVSAEGGDRWVSVSEIQLFTAAPSTWPPRVAVDFEMTQSLWARLALLLFGVFAIVAASFHRSGSKRSVASWTLVGVSALGALYAIVATWPVDTAFVNLSRAVAAAVASAVVLRLGFRPDGAQNGPSTALLAAMAALSVLAFYNFGHPQFYDAAQRKPTYVHTWDMRVYFPAVKYAHELGYDGVYLASVKAYAQERLDDSLEPIADTPIRDLSNYQMRTVRELADEIHEVESRFTPERWTELKRDMAYFWNAMGKRTYLESLRDHGGNATPAWLLPAYWMYRSADANESTLLWGALLDPLLLLAFFVIAWRTFGLRAALVCLVAYGATTVYQFGSNWGGSTLRSDWMVLIGLGVCALESRRMVLAGMLLGWAAMIRAFPVLALVFLIVPVGWKLVDALRATGAGGGNRRPWANLTPLLRVGMGVIVVVAVLGAASTATFGWEKSWGAWSDKISMHANRPNVNHVGLTALVSFDPDNLWNNLRRRGEDPELWGPRTAQTMKDRRWMIIAGMVLYTVLAVLACRRLRLSDAAVIGTMLIPIYFYPSNYYLHVLFLWPLMLAAWNGGGRSKEWALAAATVLLTCAIQWFGWSIPGNYSQFLFWSGTLLVAVAALLLIPIAGDRRCNATRGTA